jgi:hypothetical protein
MPYTSQDMMEATVAANGRQDFAESQNFQTSGRALPREQERLNHRVGCLGELKCAQRFHLEFNASVGIITNVDCKILEVRTRRIENGRDLPFRSIEKVRLPYVLCWLDERAKQVTIVGWLCGWQAHERMKDTPMWKGVWFVPPPYHSVQSLQDWITAGHPLHWAPEAYR